MCPSGLWGHLLLWVPQGLGGNWDGYYHSTLDNASPPVAGSDLW